jgi:glutaredoxin 3
MFSRLKKWLRSKQNQTTSTEKTVRRQANDDLGIPTKEENKKENINNATLVLYKFDACPYCKRVQRMITELEITEQIEMRDTRLSPKWKEDLRNKTGRTQVPCLFIDGEAMFESLDIIAYLQMRFET